MAEDAQDIQSKFGIVGRETELRKALAAIRAGKHLLIEGPVGVGKTIIAESVAKHLGRPFYRVDGDERYSEQKLTGWFDPPLVIKQGYSKDAFIPGPLTLAMETGGILFINELNRMPEGVQNVLLPAMDEGRIDVPKIGTIMAKDGFLVVATQNPREFIATSVLSEALRDRFEILTLDYQSEDEEIAIVHRRTSLDDARLIRPVVKLVRATRTHPDVRRGASVRAAMSISVLAYQLTSDRRASIREAAHMALPTRIEVKDDARQSVHEIIDELFEKHCIENPGVEESATISTWGFPKSANSRTVSEDVWTADDRMTLLENLGDIIDTQSAQPSEIGLTLAQHYVDIKRKVKDQRLLRLAKKIAVRAIIYKTLQLLGPTRRSMEQVTGPYLPGQKGEIDIDMTVEEILGKTEIDASDLIIESKTPRRMACTMMLDTSLSMSGDKLAMATASVGVLAYKLKSIDYSVVAFESAARVMKHPDQKVAIETLVGDLLDVPGMGLTNIEDALRTGLRELNRTTIRDRAGIIITDGNYTTGKDPSELASEYPKLFVIMIKSHDSRPEVCEKMAALGKGKFVAVDTFEEIPGVLRILLKEFAYRRHERPRLAPQEIS